jgi:uncharacterized membrane protein YjfL (UPF0719 family)
MGHSDSLKGKARAMDIIYWDHYYNLVILTNLLIVIALFTSMRLFSGTIAHINASDELLKKDNPAFGISLAGATMAVTIMLSGTIYGSPEQDLLTGLIFVAMYGVIGIVLMAVTRIILDKITLPAIHLRDEIAAGNKAVAIADAGNVLAAAIILRAVMIWVTGNSAEGVGVMLAGFVVSQAILLGMTLLKIRMLESKNTAHRLQDELRAGNIALALRFSGHKIGAAFAIATAAQIVVYEEFDVMAILAAWVAASILVIVIWRALCWFAQSVVLFRADVDNEVLTQKNIAIGALQAVIFISLGFLISQL